MPIRRAVSPRTLMMKGDATCKAPKVAAPATIVRRLGFSPNLDDLMISPPLNCCCTDTFNNAFTPTASNMTTGLFRSAVLVCSHFLAVLNGNYYGPAEPHPADP